MKRLGTILNERTVFPALRAAAIAAGVLGTLIAAWLAAIGVNVAHWSIREREASLIAAALVGLLTVLAVSVCCWRALIIFYRMVGRLSRGSAFTEENVLALMHIAWTLALAGGALSVAIALLLVIVRSWVLPLLYLVVFALMFFGLALIACALGILVRRAAALQQDSDLTI